MIEPSPRMPCALSAELVAQAIRCGRFDLSTEAATQAGIHQLLVEQLGEHQVSREHRLGPGDRLDFLVAGCIVVEVKRFRRTTARQAMRQLERYAAYPEVTELVLATGQAVGFPGHVGGKRLITVNLGRGWL